MFRYLLVISTLCVGCANADGPDLQGRWFGESLVNVDSQYLASASGWVRGTSFEFTGDSVTVTIPTDLPRTAPYEVVAHQDRQVTIAVHRPNGQRDVAQFTMQGAHVMNWDIGQNRAVVLRRLE